MKYQKKKFYTDAAVDAFRFYFEQPRYLEELLCQSRSLDRTGPKGSGLSDPVASETVRKETILLSNKPYVEKWEAARKAVIKLESEPDGELKLTALKAAYGGPFNKGVIYSVRYAATHIHADERTAWRWIHNACRYWAEFRGLVKPERRNEVEAKASPMKRDSFPRKGDTDQGRRNEVEAKG